MSAVYRPALALAAGLLTAAVALGMYWSLRSDHRLPAVNLLVYGPADHVETMLLAGDYAGAIDQLRQYARTSNDRLPHERLGDVFERLGPDARAGVEAALAARADYAEGHYQLALAYAAGNDLPRTADHLAQFVRLRPRNAQAHNMLGVTLAQQGRLAEAAAQFREAVTLDPSFADALENLATVTEAAEAPASDTP
jgi:superkiller protein 3